MKLAAVYICWHDWDLLEYSLKNIRPLVDGVIIVGSETSNYGEKSPVPDWPDIYIREPQFRDARNSETDKRNYGLNIARQQGYTHFIPMDADEFYDPADVLWAKGLLNDETVGLVCHCETYFKSPQLTIGKDRTLVPFIHKITPTLKHEFNMKYPFAWEDGQIRIDPTRSMNINSGVNFVTISMHHYSYVRKDIQVKIRNSTARSNIQRKQDILLNDLVLAKEGYFCQFYQRHLQRSTVDFGIPEFP